MRIVAYTVKQDCRCVGPAGIVWQLTLSPRSTSLLGIVFSTLPRVLLVWAPFPCGLFLWFPEESHIHSPGEYPLLNNVYGFAQHNWTKNAVFMGLPCTAPQATISFTCQSPIIMQLNFSNRFYLVCRIASSAFMLYFLNLSILLKLRCAKKTWVAHVSMYGFWTSLLKFCKQCQVQLSIILSELQSGLSVKFCNPLLR